ncbi:hypothetical protein [Verminephrobacter aporrectodeae]|uniref:hypothetical protein n=1 Tax=Verminephrobacter aporrectodeae TaxID=1110389 RepID=UPI002244E5AC|nr:hypothetical protein [Verminephrobacter aporrectodeae]
MESENNETSGGIRFNQYRMSWVAYVRPALVFFLLSALAVVLGTLNPSLGVVAALVALAIFVYQVLYLRSMILFTDDDGVWFFRGVFPWNKGITGVKWRDVEDAVFFTGFVSWAFNSYSIRVGHRFTKASELVIPNVRDGHNAVVHINEVHLARLGDSDR